MKILAYITAYIEVALMGIIGTKRSKEIIV